ncbi:ABC transporter permease [Bifidobacterium aquikefiricola]|uniref:ABC transporter permease n=1 Tax=Bifidobacterium aquikefiricola TaxID=3059038 RepID=A0AB39U8T4_9BIFI
MWTTFLTTIKVNLREKSNLLWLFIFPILLASLFWGMFSGLTNSHIQAQNFAVVHDSNWESVAGADSLVTALAGKNTNGTKLIHPTTVSSVSVAKKRVQTKHDNGYLFVNDQGSFSLAISDDLYTEVTDPLSSSTAGITISSLRSIITQFNHSQATLKALAATHPAASMQERMESQNQARAQIERYVTASAASATLKYTRNHSLTHFAPDQFARYYYALLGMVSMMSMSFAIVSITTAQANLSYVGARRSIAPLPKWRQFIAILLASWLTSFLSLVLSFCYIRFVCNIAVGGREPLAIVALLIASFTATTFGLLIGTIPRLSRGAKSGISTAIACFGALFAGLYGSLAMNLSDYISRNLPKLDLFNPVKQVSNLFYDLLYYDSLQPFMTTIGILLITAAICMTLAISLMRRRSYANL